MCQANLHQKQPKGRPKARWKDEGKAIPLQPLGLQEVEAPRISRQSAHEGGKAVCPTHGPPPPPPPEILALYWEWKKFFFFLT